MEHEIESSAVHHSWNSNQL